MMKHLPLEEKEKKKKKKNKPEISGLVNEVPVTSREETLSRFLRQVLAEPK